MSKKKSSKKSSKSEKSDKHRRSRSKSTDIKKSSVSKKESKSKKSKSSKKSNSPKPIDLPKEYEQPITLVSNTQQSCSSQGNTPNKKVKKEIVDTKASSRLNLDYDDVDDDDTDEIKSEDEKAIKADVLATKLDFINVKINNEVNL